MLSAERSIHMINIIVNTFAAGLLKTHTAMAVLSLFLLSHSSIVNSLDEGKLRVWIYARAVCAPINT